LKIKEVMGCSNPHPHGQIWAQSSLPTEVEKTQNNLKAYFDKHNRTLLQDYVQEEMKLDERIVIENEYFVCHGSFGQFGLRNYDCE
jgi:UDPglucose--hexose-1-phosphate uridylyltransferase